MVGDYQRLIAFLDMTHGLTQRKLSDDLSAFLVERPQYQSVGVSAPTISRNMKTQHSLREKTIEFNLFEAYLSTKGFLSGSFGLSDLLHKLRNDEACNEHAQTLMRKKRSSISFETVKHVMGIWQTINYSTYVSQSSSYGKVPPDQIRFGLRFLTPHEEARPNRLRLRVCDIGPSTLWDGSADINANSIYMRIREVSMGLHSGERIFSIFCNPHSHDARANKAIGKYITYGCTVAAVRESAIAPQHIAFEIAALRYLPALNDMYYPEIPDAYTDDSKVNAFLADQDKLAKDYCLRKPVNEVLLVEGSPKYGKEAYIDIKSIIDSIGKREILETIGSNTLAYIHKI